MSWATVELLDLYIYLFYTALEWLCIESLHCIDIILFCTERTAEATPSQTYDVIIAATPADAELVTFIKGGLHKLVIVSVLNMCRRSSCCL